MPSVHRIAVAALALALLPSASWPQEEVTKYVRYSHSGQIRYGILEDGTIRELTGSLFESPRETGSTVSLSAVQLLAPAEPSKVLAVGRNYQSHLGGRPAADYPGSFAKFPTSIAGPGDPIVIPREAQDLHYEGEMVIVIGRTARNVSVQDAPDYVFSVTAGNDVSERSWQQSDLQWLRAKASDGFAPLGPAIARGLDYNDLLVQTRVNGAVRQSESTKDLIFSVDDIVSYVSRYVTLLPGDVIFTGTPGSTAAMQPGDVVEIEVEGVGVLRNTVKAAEQESSGQALGAERPQL